MRRPEDRVALESVVTESTVVTVRGRPEVSVVTVVAEDQVGWTAAAGVTVQLGLTLRKAMVVLPELSDT